MYKVICGHRYNTESARKLASWSTNCSTSNFNYYKETLYRTKSDQYFLHGEGGPMTRYAVQNADGSIGWGEKIEPISEESAKIWVEKKCNGEDYDRIFGDAEEPGSGRQFCIKLCSSDAQRFEEIKKATGKAYTDLVSEWIQRYDADAKRSTPKKINKSDF